MLQAGDVDPQARRGSGGLLDREDGSGYVTWTGRRR